MLNKLNNCFYPTGVRTAILMPAIVVLFCLLNIVSPEAATNRNGAPDIAASLATSKAKTNKTLDEVSKRIAVLEKLEAPDAAQKSELNWLIKAKEFLQKSVISIDRTLDFYQASQGATPRLKSIEKELAQALPSEMKINSSQSLANLELQLETAREELANVRRLRDDVESEAAQRSDRTQKITDDTANARKRVEELNQLLAAPVPADIDRSNEARRMALAAEQGYLNQQLQELDQEFRSYENRRELLRARRQHSERQVLVAEQRFNVLEQAVNQLRAQAAAQAVQAADSASIAGSSAHPLLREILDENQKLASELAQVLAQSTALGHNKKVIEETLSTIKRQHEGVKDKVSQIGLTDAIGLKLRSDRNQLPDTSNYEASLKERRSEVNRVQLRRIEIEDRMLELVDTKRVSQQRVESLPGLTESEKNQLQKVVNNALEEQKNNYLSELIKAYDIYFEKNLFPIMENERELVALIDEYKEFIDTRILWIQSAPMLELGDIKRTINASLWLLDPVLLGNTLTRLAVDLKENALSIFPLLIIVVLLLGFYRQLKLKLSELGRYVTKLSKAKFSDTLLSAVITMLIVLPWPLLLYVIAWRLEQSGGDQAFAAAMSAGFYAMSYALFSGLVIRRICRVNGLGESHFRWKNENLLLVRQQIIWYLPAILPLVFIVAASFNQPTQAHHDSLGRVAFIVLMVVTSMLLYKLMHPSRGLFKNTIEKNPDGWASRLSGLWFPVLMLSPLALAIVATVGYFYTAIELSLYFISTVGLIFAVIIVREFLLRWLNIAQRKLALEQWRKRITAQSETVEGEQKSLNSDGMEPYISEEPGVDVTALSAQTLKLLNSAFWITMLIGTWFIWAEVLPAFKLLNEIVLWSSAVTSTEGGASLTTQLPTTLADILLAITILVMTFFISSNIPGLLEIAILQRLPFTPSGRYAITTIARYILVIVGLAMTFSAMGVGWSKVQWLAAAITVGLGFGLQEIFANFVSGLIILFERQIRVGDAVTVGNISGKVSRIQMRATTIVDWDRKELIIPNKEFVTGQVINWSLSDTVLRLLIRVGIAYGSDTALARDILIDVAQKHPDILKDPEPNALFVGFGESTLDFELRVFVPHPDLRIDTQHDLLMEIDRRFREANIEIAFPQRDIHIRDIPENAFHKLIKPQQT